MAILLIILSFFALSLFLIRRFLYVTHVVGNSMVPTYMHKDRLLVMKYISLVGLKKNMIVVCEIPNQPLELAVKRIISMPHETFRASISDVHEKAITNNLMHLYDQDGYKDWFIPDRHYFLSGDNKGTDSRVWGPVSEDKIKGIVLMKLNPSTGQS